MRKFISIACTVLMMLSASLTFAELQGPVEYPEGKPMSGGKEVVKYDLDDMLTYKKLESYSQPAWMDKLVEDGTLPPVEERLPEEPFVYLASGMSSGPGEYGGMWRDFSAVPTEGWNLAAGQTQGWFGINYIYQESLTKSGPMFMRKDKAEPLPNLAKSWKWAEDGKVLIMDLIKGAKWSDGDPFDAEDVIFTWEDMILDPQVNSWTSRSTWQISGEDITLEAIDEYTLKWTFPKAYPIAYLFNMDFLDFSIAPAHWLKPKHPKYNTDMDYVSFENCMPPNDLPVPSMGPWIPVSYKTDEFMVMRRNPYYWKVDENGKQLPYLDEVTFEKGSSGIGRTMGTMAGSLDHTNLENPGVFVETLKRMQQPDAHFYVEWGPEMLSFPLELNLSANLGVTSDRDRELRKLFRDLRFRRAVSQAIDREGVGQSIIRGPFLRPFPGGIYPGSLYYDRASVVFYPYAPDTSKALLAELGFKDTDGDGVLNWTDGALKGENLIIQLNANEDQVAGMQVAEALVPMLGAIGIQVNYRPIKQTVLLEKINSGVWEMLVERGESQYAVPFTKYNEIAPLTDERPYWHRAGAEPRELLPFEEDLIRLTQDFSVEVDFEKRKAQMSEFNKIFTENIYRIDTVVGRYGLALAKRFQNVPTGTPPFFYQWTWGNVQPDQVWVKPEDQLQQTMPNTVPIYKK
ncbi:galactoside ABC transporter substrate-binding protein [candidate division KSB3 bacterium]|uniref:Galactoside ABC transporter substrate-binding protein n=1 Tax=candidate division KSB3 bacterium TaxID=2044937 RepID=A0A2G6KCC2_9BACT|nr:MAG: galactoside ABC transporter substrate-binding protein [candidate division KSB3 bacterium]